MTLDQGLFLLILAAGLYLFVSERLRVDVGLRRHGSIVEHRHSRHVDNTPAAGP